MRKPSLVQLNSTRSFNGAFMRAPLFISTDAASETFSPALRAARVRCRHLNRLERTAHVVPRHPEQEGCVLDLSAH